MINMIANPFIINAMSSLVNIWFDDSEKARAMSFASLTVPTGVLIGLLLTGYISSGTIPESQNSCMQTI